jgi:hypothetical protein
MEVAVAYEVLTIPLSVWTEENYEKDIPHPKHNY